MVIQFAIIISLLWVLVASNILYNNYSPEHDYRPATLALRYVLRCATQCSPDDQCPGFDVTLTTQQCSPLQIQTMAPSTTEVTRYWKHNYVTPSFSTQPQFSGCDPITALYQASSGSVRLLFKGHDKWEEWRISSSSDVTSMTSSNSRNDGSKSTMYPDRAAENPDAGMQISNTLVMFFFGANVEVHEYKSGLGRYKIMAGYPRTIVDEVKPAIAPLFVNAAHCEDGTVYLLMGGTIFQYTITGSTPPARQYSLIATYAFPENSAANPFSDPSGSAEPPSRVSALYGDGTRLIAFSGMSVHQYLKSTARWSFRGTLARTFCNGNRWVPEVDD